MHSLQWSRIIAARPVQSTDRLGSGKARGVIWGSPGEKGLHRGVEHQREGLGGGGEPGGPPTPSSEVPPACGLCVRSAPGPKARLDI